MPNFKDIDPAFIFNTKIKKKKNTQIYFHMTIYNARLVSRTGSTDI